MDRESDGSHDVCVLQGVQAFAAVGVPDLAFRVVNTEQRDAAVGIGDLR